MHSIAKFLAILWTLICAGWAALTLSSSATVASHTLNEDDQKVAAEIRRENPGLSQLESERKVTSRKNAGVAGSACCATLGVGSAGIAWVAGITPLLVIMLLTRPRVIVEVRQGSGVESKS